MQFVKNEVHCLEPVSNFFWINDIKCFQTGFISWNLAQFDQQK